MMKNRKLILLNLFWFIVIAILSYRMPMYNDDYLHSTSFATGEDITGIGMIIPSVVEYYNIWGGRALSMFLIQLMLLLPRWVYALCNGLIYVAVVNAAYAYLPVGNENRSGRDHRYELTAVLFLIMWFFMPDFAEVVTWLTGTITYLWFNLFILIFGALYYIDYYGHDPESKAQVTGKKQTITMIARILLYVILGFIAGLSAEASACTLVFALMLYVIGSIRSGRHITIDKWCGIISCLTGFAFLMLAPGNRVRSSVASSEAEAGAGFFTLYAHRFGRETFYLVLFLSVAAAISISLYAMTGHKKTGIKVVAKDISAGYAPFFVILSVVSVYVMTFPSGFANRIFQFPLIMLAIAAGKSLMQILNESSMPDERLDSVMKGIRIFIVIMLFAVVVEIVAGVLFSTQSGTFFDRQMLYYHYDDPAVDGLLPGNGIISQN